jgi:hypothetical protein
MPGAGAATVAFVKENGFQSEPSTPDYYLPGRDITTDTIEAQNALSRLTLPDQAESVESLAGRFETGLSANWAMSADRVGDVQDIVFNGANGQQFVGGERAATSSWYLGLDHLSGVSERNLTGVYPTEYTVEYSEDENAITESITAVAADESEGTSITPSSIQSAGEGQTIPFHGAELSVGGSTQAALSSFTLTISNIANPITGASRHPLDAVCGRPETTLDFTYTMQDGPDQLAAAYGGSGATEPQSQVSGQSATITLSVGGTTATTLNLSNTTPDTESWESLVTEENAGESISAQVHGVTVS